MKKYWIALVATSILLGSCNKWLDIQPEAQVSEDQLFSTEEGFEESLNGIYTRCIQTDIYGEELTFGLPEVLAQNYTLYSFNGLAPELDYSEDVIYNFTNSRFIARKDKIWQGLYNAIGNCNLLLKNLELKKTLFTPSRYALLKGEALGLRGYLHFDALRLFAPSYTSNPVAKAIPYVVTFTDAPTPLSTVSETLDKIVTDLKEAKALLAPVDSIAKASYVVGYESDPTVTENSAPFLFLQNRRNRMNYYAVCGSLARVYLYKDDKINAALNAQEIIDAKKFPWTTKADFINSNAALKDRINYKEVMFGWPIPKQEENLVKRFKVFTFSKTDGDILYEYPGIAAEDNRYKEWLLLNSTNSTYELQKYVRNQNAKTDDATTNRHPLTAPAIRLSEMYYILAECTYDTDPTKANALVDSVRYHRGIGIPFTASSKAEFLDGLVREARKELYAEGQIFYMYKRLNKSIIGPAGRIYPAGYNIFVLPLPNDEIEYGGR
ncbi:SusD family protein [Filimonas lacunae]|uniref:SusD family protein n=1 Tax=Filimonas lacunae TaxID=477680 RepID=A0A173MC32_9BACT|nr:RagB/SusD family nutrient uptake outer membrane protein [Filimonas lacunae]BAV05122.1 hypothetical protein FLA_1129 [Filimonas lacunae]SIT34195.1 SusD family protein [Filimonas lacunae]